MPWCMVQPLVIQVQISEQTDLEPSPPSSGLTVAHASSDVNYESSSSSSRLIVAHANSELGIIFLCVVIDNESSSSYNNNAKLSFSCLGVYLPLNGENSPFKASIHEH